MSNYIISPDGKLYHADDYLQHWKYIKREKLPNGKYKYYYDIGQNEKRTADRASAETNFSKALLQVVMANKAEYQKTIDAHTEYYKGPTYEDVRKMQYYDDQIDKLIDRVERDENASAQAYEAYSETPLGKIENTMKRGKDYVEKMIDSKKKPKKKKKKKKK